MKTSNLFLSRAPVWVVALCLAATSASALAQSGSSYGSTSSPTSSTSSTNSSNSAATLKWADKRFVTKVAEGSQLEIAMAQLASTRATNADVRNFAQQLVTDHNQLSQTLQQLAERKGVQDNIAEYASYTSGGGSHAGAMMPTGATSSASSSTSASAGSGSSTTASGSDWNDPTTNRHYRRLAAKQGADFDKEFISMMVSDHEDDISLFEKKAKNADDADVRSFAENALPTLREHLANAQKLQSAVGS